MKSFIKAVTLLYLFVILISCSSNPIEPEPQPGSRDYVWTVDTLNMPMNFLGAIWGSSPNDVWASGAGGSPGDNLLHFDGNRWTTYRNEPIYCNGNTLFGFSKTNIWMGGNNEGRIWHYDGLRWSENYRYNVEGSRNVGITNIWGQQPNDVYACGVISYLVNGKDLWRGFVLHYNGSTWKEIVKANFNSQFIKIRVEEGNAYLFTIRTSYTVSDTIAFYQLNRNELIEVYSNTTDKITFGNFSLIGGRLYFWISKDVYLLKNGAFTKQFSIENPNFWYLLFGRNPKDIFVSMRDGLAHYNGNDIQYVFKYPNIYHKIVGGEPLLFEKDVFCGFFDMANNKNLILRGKLKE
jgi:hypothetical protein